MATTSAIAVTEGSGKNGATYSITEDAITKQIQRATLNTSAGVEIGVAAAPVVVAGAVADNAADSGLPLKVGGVYNASAPTYDTGDRGNLQIDVAGNLKVSLATKLAGEDLTGDVIKVEQRNNYAYISSATTTTIKSGAGFLHTLTILGGTAGVVTVYDNTAGSGSVIAAFGSTNALQTYTFDVTYATGLTVVTAAGTQLTVSYR